MRSCPPPPRTSPRTPCLIAVTLVALSLAACREQSPEERVAELRRGYSAELNSFVVEQVPLEPAAAPSEGELDEGGSEGDGGGTPEPETSGEGEGGEGEEVPVRTDVILDILVQNRAIEPLPGLTLDVSQAGGAGDEKDHWRVWVDTSDLLKGRGQTLIHRLEDVDFTEGDGFHVEVRHPIPAAERDEYREFTEAGAAG